MIGRPIGSRLDSRSFAPFAGQPFPHLLRNGRRGGTVCDTLAYRRTKLALTTHCIICAFYPFLLNGDGATLTQINPPKHPKNKQLDSAPTESRVSIKVWDIRGLREFCEDFANWVMIPFRRRQSLCSIRASAERNLKDRYGLHRSRFDSGMAMRFGTATDSQSLVLSLPGSSRGCVPAALVQTQVAGGFGRHRRASPHGVKCRPTKIRCFHEGHPMGKPHACPPARAASTCRPLPPASSSICSLDGAGSCPSSPQVVVAPAS